MIKRLIMITALAVVLSANAFCEGSDIEAFEQIVEEQENAAEATAEPAEVPGDEIPDAVDAVTDDTDAAVEAVTEAVEEAVTAEPTETPQPEATPDAGSWEDPFNADSATIDAALAIMNNDACTQTRAYLAEGNNAGLYCANVYAKGIQTVLAALGKNVSTDGKLGEQTIAVLNEVQTGMGLPVTDTVDGALFDRLLLCAVCKKDPDAAAQLLGSDNEKYVEAYAQLASGHNYAARCLFESIAGTVPGAAELAENCVLAKPADGEVWRDPSCTGEGMQLTIELAAADEGKSCYFKIYNDKDVNVSGLFFNGTGSVSTRLPGGTYSVKVGTGTDWYGTTDAFGTGDDASYEVITFADGSEKAFLSKGYAYTLTVRTAELSDSLDEVATHTTDWENF